jgi:ABC-type sugar transport system substrate-binding protein
MTPVDHTRRRRSLPLRRGAALVAVAAALGLAACSSSSSSSSSSTPSTSTSSSGTSTSASASSSATSSSASGLSAADQTGLAQAAAVVAKQSVRPTSITDTTKVTKAIPKGLTIDFIPCGSPECTLEGNIVKQAAALVGWNTVILPNDGSATGDKDAFTQAVRNKAAAILYTAIPASVFASLLPQIKADNIFISTCCVTDAVGPTTGIGYEIDGPAEVGPVGGVQAAWVADNSKDTADAVFVNIPAFAILATQATYFKTQMGTYCPTCKVNEINIALANLATAPTTIVSYLRANPSVHYVVASTDAITIGLPAALKAAGITDVQIVGQGATPTNIQYLHSGEQSADAAFPYYEVMYAMVNAAIQDKADGTVAPSVAPPSWLLTPQNAPNTSAEVFPVVTNYEAEYKALWASS